MCYPYSLEKRVNGWYKLLLGVVIVFGLIALVVTTIFNYRINSISEELNALKTPKNEVISHNKDILTSYAWVEQQSKMPVTDETALCFMQQIGIEHPHIVLAQMKLESGNYTSKLALENNNYFGMKQPRKRATTTIGEKNGYASYKSWVHSVLDYALWQKEYARSLTEVEYLDSLTTYAEDSSYKSKVQQIANKYKN
jgi:hypothetical protein